MPNLSKEKSISLLQRAEERVKAFEQSTPLPKIEAWLRDTRLAIKNIFGEMSQQSQEFESLLADYHNEKNNFPFSKVGKFVAVAPGVSEFLASLVREVQDFWPDDPPALIVDGSDGKAHVVSPAAEPPAPLSKDVFIIHGHDHGIKEAVARFLSKVGLNPIILHEQANRGKAVIEKFEEHAAVSYAVALLTPDDVGAAKAERDNLQPRPRQNVLFEFGYFIGKLGRGHVCGLTTAGVEIPSDYSGVLLIQLDAAGAWRLELLRELRAAGLPVDVNAAL